MHLAILSDTHDNHRTVTAALGIIRERGIRTVLHCGDICDVETVRLFAGFDTHFVFGNCDFHRARLRYAIEEIGSQLSENFGELELDGIQIAWTHGDNPALFRELEHNGKYDYLFYGHSHTARQHLTGNTRVVNPGALQRARVKSLVILDSKHRTLESVTID
jgi:putative phosphoesterase